MWLLFLHPEQHEFLEGAILGQGCVFGLGQVPSCGPQRPLFGHLDQEVMAVFLSGS